MRGDERGGCMCQIEPPPRAPMVVNELRGLGD